jgi:hypothetical protein
MAKARQFKEFLPVIISHPPTGSAPIVIGGQAVNYWCEQAQGKNKALAAYQPFTSHDLDLVAHDPAQTSAIAKASGLKLVKAGPHYSGADLAALVDPKTQETLIQILSGMYGVGDEELCRNTADIAIEDSKGKEHKARIANRTALLKGKIALALAPDGMRSPADKEHDRFHLRLLILCLAVAGGELMDGIGKVHDERTVIKSLKALLKVIRSKDALKVSAMDPSIIWRNAISPRILKANPSRHPKLAKYVATEIQGGSEHV